jgi:hypothetical protein
MWRAMVDPGRLAWRAAVLEEQLAAAGGHGGADLAGGWGTQAGGTQSNCHTTAMGADSCVRGKRHSHQGDEYHGLIDPDHANVAGTGCCNRKAAVTDSVSNSCVSNSCVISGGTHLHTTVTDGWKMELLHVRIWLAQIGGIVHSCM